VYRFQALKLNKKRNGKPRLPAESTAINKQGNINKTVNMDFMSDAMACNRKFRTFNLIDDCSREIADN
jgi:putative transposase